MTCRDRSEKAIQLAADQAMFALHAARGGIYTGWSLLLDEAKSDAIRGFIVRRLVEDNVGERFSDSDTCEVTAGASMCAAPMAVTLRCCRPPGHEGWHQSLAQSWKPEGAGKCKACGK